MKILLLASTLWLLPAVTQAATLTWDAQTITSPLTVERSATHVEIVCNGISMRTTGSGLRRVVECVR